MLSKVSLRLKLSDFINTDIEEKVMNIINHAHNELSVTVLLYLWFEEGEIVSKDLKKFLIKWEDKLSFKTIIKQGHEIKFSDFIWFDIVPVSTSTTLYKRFEYKYVGYNKILDGLREFYNITNFTLSEKPMRKQKRNDYVD